MSRLLTAVIALPVLIASIWFPQLKLLFILLAVAAMTLGLYEFYLLARRGEMQPNRAVGMTAAFALFTIFGLNSPFNSLIDLLPAVLIALTIAALVASLLRGAPFNRMLASTAATVLGVMYVVVLGGHLILVRTSFPEELGSDLLFFFFLVLMGSDSAAYYTGRLLGKHKLAPSISPGKTWEGAAGGMLASLLAAVLAHFTFFPVLSLAAALPLAAAMNVLGVVGDLTESALKRGANAKDAAQILPGHGGLLDRLDSLLFNAPLLYYFAIAYFFGI